MTRTDEHRISEFKPESYDFLFDYCHPSSDGFPGYNIALLRATIHGTPQAEPQWGFANGRVQIVGTIMVESQWGKLNYFRGGGRCSICGTGFGAGSVYRHRETGESIHVGWICAAKYDMISNHDAAQLYRDRVAAARRTKRARSQRFSFLRETFTEMDGGREILAALKLDHPITRDIRSQLLACPERGLTDKQITLLVKLVADRAKRADEEKDKRPIPAELLDGRHEITGEVLSAKWRNNGYADVLKLTIKVATADGFFLLWGSAPKALTRMGDEPARGDTVTLTAAIEKGDRDEAFGFWKRPTKATIVKAPEMAEIAA